MTQGNEAVQMGLPGIGFGGAVPREQKNLPQSAGLKLRDRGMDAVENHNLSWVKQMRRQARRICKVKGYVTTDDLRAIADLSNLQPLHRNAWGTVFRGSEWKPIALLRSTRPAAHGRKITAWALQ